MKRATLVCTFVLVGAMVVGAIGLQGLHAEEKEYKPKAKVTPLVQKALMGVEGKDVLIRHFELPPGFVGGKHFHPGPVFVYILEGEFTVDTEKGRQTFKVGEVYEEPTGRVMQARNLSTASPLKLVVFQVGDKGKPMMIKAK